MKRSTSNDNEGLPVAQSVWAVAEEPSTMESGLRAELISEQQPEDVSAASAAANKKNEGNGLWSSEGYQQYHLTTGEGNNQSYWGRFDDAQAEVLPESGEGGAIPATTARLDDRQIRLRFIRKVYTILSVQLLATFAMCALITLNSAVRGFALGQGIGLLYVNMVLMFVLICALHAYKVRPTLTGFCAEARMHDSRFLVAPSHREPILRITCCLRPLPLARPIWLALSRRFMHRRGQEIWLWKPSLSRHLYLLS